MSIKKGFRTSSNYGKRALSTPTPKIRRTPAEKVPQQTQNLARKFPLHTIPFFVYSKKPKASGYQFEAEKCMGQSAK
jgi:hypothetical protein